jgi:hypothetical protein
MRFVKEAVDQGHLSLSVDSPHDYRKFPEESFFERAHGIWLLPKCEVKTQVLIHEALQLSL